MFYKYHSLSNDFILKEVNHLALDYEKLAQALCSRTDGIGADGVIFYKHKNQNSYFVSLYNQDGTKAELSGNGFSSLALHLSKETSLQKFIFTSYDSEFEFSIQNNLVTFKLNSFKDIAKKAFQGITYYVIDIGNPHAIVFDNLEFKAVESLFNNKVLFKNGINLSFAKVLKDELKLKVYERGVGLTKSCSSGALATGIISHLFAIKSLPLKIIQVGGSSIINYQKSDNSYSISLKPIYIAKISEFNFLGQILC